MNDIFALTAEVIVHVHSASGGVGWRVVLLQRPRLSSNVLPVLDTPMDTVMLMSLMLHYQVATIHHFMQ